MLLIQMDLEGVCLSTGSACSAGTLEPSHVLTAMFGDEAIEVDAPFDLVSELEQLFQK